MSQTESTPPAAAATELAEPQPDVGDELQKITAEQESMNARLSHVTSNDESLANLLDTKKFDHVWRIATCFAQSDMVPIAFRAKPQNCFIAIQLALRLGVDPFMLMQNTYVVHGRPGFEAKLAIALVNQRGPFRDRIQWIYRGEGEHMSVTAFAYDRDSGNLYEATCSIAMAKRMGWWSKKDSLWPRMPEQMLAYRSAMFLIRQYCPEVLMGITHSRDELEDTFVDVPSSPPTSALTGPPPQSRSEELVRKMQAMRQPYEPEQEPEPLKEADTPAPQEDQAVDRVQLLADYHQEVKDAQSIERLTELRLYLGADENLDDAVRAKIVTWIDAKEKSLPPSKPGELFNKSKQGG